MSFNTISLNTICASLTYAMGIKAPEKANDPSKEFKDFIDNSFGETKADRIFMYNPDAIAQWVYEKYYSYTEKVREHTSFTLPLSCVMPSVTPVCFGTMYTGADPEVHGIQKYEKPILKIDSIFDALIRAGKKAAIVAETKCSMSMIYLEREMDYFIYDTIEEVNAKAEELIKTDEYDFIAVYNGNYDELMHKYGPEHEIPLGEFKKNTEAFDTFAKLIKENWKKHNTLIGFAMDHGCHEIDGESGSHGLYMEEDINIVHLYGAYSAN